MTERKIDKMKEFLIEKIEFHSQHSKYTIPETRKEVHKAKGEAYIQALKELERIAEAEEPGTITIQAQSLNDERMKPEIPEEAAAFIEKMRRYYIAPGFYETPENEAAVLAYHTMRFFFGDGEKSKKTAALLDKVKTWLTNRDNFFVLIDAIRRGYVVKKGYYYIRLTEEASKALNNGNKNVRYLKVSENYDEWYFGSIELDTTDYVKEFNEQEKDMWMDKLKAIPLEAVKVKAISVKP